MIDLALADTAVGMLRAVLEPMSALWLFFWPARHALLTVAMLLLYVHGFEGGSEDEDPYFF